MKLVKLPESGSIIDMDAVLFITREEINKYIVITSTPTPRVPLITGGDVDALISAGFVVVLEIPKQLAAA